MLPAAPGRTRGARRSCLPNLMLQPSRNQLLGCFLLLGAILCLLMFRYFRVLAWSR
ncbi:MAG TPA: hypothetical protein VGW33_13120 [Terriglobia bacterium]|nr:hypothetical protein [Terriglobia bacterium]